jgi:AcrR family transcriptional regulator
VAKPDESIDPRILESARKEFLSKPFDQVSLRKICAQANVTTGAFYKRYKNKEELFDAVVAPTLALVAKYSDQRESISYDRLSAKELQLIWELTPDTQRETIDMLYDNYDGFRLLLCHAEGTRHANFIHDFVNDVTARSYRFIEETHRRGIIDDVIDEEELHMLLTAYWSTMFEPIVHGLPREKAIQHSNIVAKLFDWTAVLGF